MDFKNKLDSMVKKINDALNVYLAEKDAPEGTLYKAMKYSVDAGGKRLRPVLALAVCEMLGGNEGDIMPFACAVEMIHTYSLIHDDLPAMDNDDYRRGRLTNHKVFGEAMSILAGDALLNKAFEIMSESLLVNPDNMMSKAKAMGIVAGSSGTSGMIGGQVVDMESEGKKINIDLLNYMHKCKTGALIKAPVLSAAVICQASEEDYLKLETFAEKLGLAFQIKDDILDVEGNQELLGKPIGSDALNEKSTYVTLFGIEDAKKTLESVTNEAIESLNSFGDSNSFLVELANYLLRRQN